MLVHPSLNSCKVLLSPCAIHLILGIQTKRNIFQIKYIMTITSSKAFFIKNSQMKENEMVTEGGEVEFLKKMVDESNEVKSQVSLFTSLVGRKKTVPQIKKYIEEKAETLENETIEFYKTEFAQGTTIRSLL